MDKCSKCEHHYTWKCISCNIFLCSSHKMGHSNDYREHFFISFRPKVSEYLKQKVLNSLSTKLQLIDQYSNQIIKSSKILIEQLTNLSKETLNKLEDHRKRISNILKLLDIEILETQLKEIEKEVENTLVYENCLPKQEDSLWHEQEIFKESLISPDRNEELLRIGSDFMQEVLRISLLRIVPKYVDVVESGVLKGTDWIYNGGISNKLRHGSGVCEYISGALSGQIYDGEWKNDLQEGRGLYKWTRGKTKGDTYDGEWKCGKKEGRGLFKSGNGDTYEGEWKEDLKEGRGAFKGADGHVYDGEWKKDKSEGRGVYKWLNGSVYDGGYKNDLREGRGIFKWSNGDVYNGGWKNNLKEGRGVFTRSNGEKYDGEWTKGKKEGSGVYKWGNGEIYSGQWKADLREGKGVFTSSNGDVCHGQWKNGNKIS